MDQRRDLREANRLRKEPLPPEQEISLNDGFYVILIDRRVVFANSIAVGALLVCADDPVLISKGDPVIRDNGRRKERVSSAAFGAPEPADSQREGPFRKENASFIVRMDRKTGGMAAGAGQMVKLEAVNERIVRNLRKMVVIFDRNEYHSLVRRIPLRDVTCNGTADGLFQGESAVLLYSNKTNNTTKGTA